MRIHAAFLLAACLVAAAAAAAPPRGAGGEQRPARDPAAAASVGSARLSGRVLAADTGRPLSRARITASARDVQQGFSTLTDPNGRFVLTDLPAGTYTINASRGGFVPMAYGAARPQRPGARVVLAEGQAREGLDISLPRGGVLSGRVWDETGEPLVRVSVRAMRYLYVQGERRLVHAGYADTDDRGQFRIYGLTPGTYIVGATVRPEGGGRGENLRPGEQPSGYAPTYYPGVPAVAEAAPITLALQQEIDSVDFVLQLVPTARVSGVVTSAGAPPPNGFVTLVPDEPSGSGAGQPGFSARVRPDGTFTIPAVPPGRYFAVARGASLARRGSPLTAVQHVSVLGSDVTNVTLALAEGGTLAGTIVAEGASGEESAVALPPLRLVTEAPAQFAALGLSTGTANRVATDGAFLIEHLPPVPQFLRVAGLPADWALKGVYLDGRDVTDAPIEVRPGEQAGGLEVVITSQPSRVRGTLLVPDDAPLREPYIVAFAQDASYWRPRSRRIDAVRPDADGVYELSGLPPGDYYVAVAEDLEPGSWYEPALLDSLRHDATRVSLTEGETKTVDLKAPQ